MVARKGNTTLVKRRWHDNRGPLSQIIELLDEMPDELRRVMVEAINGMAEKNWGVDDILKSVGTDKILALYKAQNKRRSYDEDPLLHKTINYFYVLPNDKQDMLASKSLHFTRTIVEYVANCHSSNMKPSKEEIRKLVDIFVTSGPEEARNQVQRSHPEFKFAENVQIDESGMKIHSVEKPTS